MKKLTKLLDNQGQACPYLSRQLLRLFLFIALLTMGGTNRIWADENVVSESKTWTVNSGSSNGTISDGTNTDSNGTNGVLGLYSSQGVHKDGYLKIRYETDNTSHNPLSSPDVYFNIPGNTSGTLVVTYACASTNSATFSVKLGDNQVYSNETKSQSEVTSEAIPINNTSSDVATVSFWAATKQFNVKKIEWTVGDAPSPTITISTQPVGGTYTQFTAVNALTVVASASNSATLSYQWQSASSENGSYSDISGATSASYQVANTSTSDKWYKCIVSADGCSNETSTRIRVKVEGGNKSISDLVKITENYEYAPNVAIPVGTLTTDGKILSPTGGCDYNSSGLNIKNNRYIAISVAAGATLSVTAGNHGKNGDRTLYISKVSEATNENSKVIAQGSTETLSVSPTEETVYYIHASNDIYVKNIFVSFGPTLYTVTYSNDATKGNCGTTTFTQTSAGQRTTLPVATPRPGYTFHGWDTNGDGTADVHAGAAYTPTSDITLTAVYTNTNVVGDANEGWWTAFSNFVELPKDKSIHLTFNNQCHGTATYNNWAMVVTTDANGHNGDGVQSGMGNELYFIRPNGESLDRSHTWTLYKENAGHYTEVTLSGDEETAYKAAMANADVDIQVSFDGTSIYTIAKTSASNGTKYILIDKSTNNSTNYENVYVSFTVDKCVLTFNTQDNATPSIKVAVQSNDNVKGGVAAKIASGIQLPSDRPIWAGTEVEFQAAPNTGYTLVNWTDNNNENAEVSKESYLKQTISANVNWTANFAEAYNYTAIAKCGDINLGQVANGTVAAGTTVRVPFKRYIMQEGVVYEKVAISNDYHQSFVIDANNKECVIEYTKPSEMDNIVFLTEVEDIPGVTVCSGGNIYSRASNAKAGYSEEYIEVTELPAGKYKIAGNGVNSNSAVRNGSFKVGSEEVLTTSMPQNNWYWFSNAEEFIVTEPSKLYFKTDGHSGSGLDFFFVRKTGEYVPVQENKVNITFTTEEGKAVAVVSTPNYGVTASVASGNMTTDGTALKMETETAVTINIPEGYTATMTMKASSNGGIRVNGETAPTSNTWTNLADGTYVIKKGNSLNVSMITLELTESNPNATLTSVTSTDANVEVTPAGNNVWGVVVPYNYSGGTVPVTLNYENATSINVMDGSANVEPTATVAGSSASYNFAIGTQTEPKSYTVTLAGSDKTYTINVLKLGQEYGKVINVTDFNYYVGTSGISADNNGLDRELNGVNFTFTGGHGVKVNGENLITVRTRSNTPGTVTITLNGSNASKHITKVVLGGSGFTAEAANYLTMTNGHITYRNSTELMVVPTTSTNTITFQSNGTDVNITSFKIYTDAELSFTKVTPTISVSAPAHVVTTSTVTPTLTTTPKNFKVKWTLTNSGSKSIVNIQTGVIEVGGVKGKTETVTAAFTGNNFYAAANGTASFTTQELSVKSIAAKNFTEAVTEPGQEITVTITTEPESATCYYTTDGSDPATSETRLSGKSINITQSTLVKAVAVMTEGGVEMVSDMASKSFNYKDPKLFNTVAVTSLSKVTDLTNRSNDYMQDQVLKDGSGNNACILSWGSYRLCGLDGNNYSTSKRGDYHTLKNEPAKVQNVDGFGRVIDAQNNPKAEDGTTYSMSDALGNDPLNLPVIGSFAKLQPLYNGTATVYILQNGASDWVYKKVDGKDVETYQLNKLRRRPTYVVDEFGTALSNGANGETEVVRAELASNAVFETKTFNAIQLAVAGTTDNAFDPDTKVSTISESNGAANVAYWHNLIKNRNWEAGRSMPSSGANSALVRTEANGFELMTKQYVKYTFRVTAGRTYFLLGSGTNNGLAAAKFERTNDDVDPSAEAVVIDEAATNVDNIKSNIGKQVNVQLKRTFTEGKWYSLVLPFSMNEAQVMEHFGKSAIYWFDSSDDAGNIHWKKHHYQMINAGIPVLIKVGKTFKSGTVIKNVLIQTDKIREYSYGGDYVMTGSWTKTTMQVNSYYVSNTATTYPNGTTYDAAIYRAVNPVNTNGLRAWLSPTVANPAKLTGISFASFLAEEDFDVPTSISEVLEGTDEIVTSALSNDALFNIGGQRISATSFNSLPKGVYIQNGKKFIKK